MTGTRCGRFRANKEIRKDARAIGDKVHGYVAATEQEKWNSLQQ